MITRSKAKDNDKQRRSVIKFISEKGKDLYYLKNWRPISLQNIDPKLLSLVFARRCQQVLPKIIQDDQN